MKLKKTVLDILILAVPVIIMFLLIPILPDKISIHRGLTNTYIDKKYAFILGLLPFIIYKIRYDKR